MTQSWKTGTLSDVLEISRERVEPSEYADRLFNYVGLENIEGHTGRLLKFEPTIGKEIKSTKNVFHCGQILYGKLRPYLNKVHLTQEEGICSTDIFVLAVNPTRASPNYVAYFLRSAAVLDRVSKLMAGANLPRLAQEGLLETSIPLPPLPEQQRLVRILDEADALRQLRARADARTNDFIPALFNEMFGDPATNPKGWKTDTLSEFGATIRYGLGQPPKTYEDGIPLLRATNVKRGLITREGLVRVRAKDVPESRNAFLKADEVIVVRSGAYTGDVARVGEEWEGSVAGYDLVVNPGDKFTGTFIAFFLLTNSVQQDYFAGLKVRAAQPHLNAQQVGATPMFLPPLSLQREFAARVAEVRALQAHQARSRQRLEDLFQALLHRAFAGVL